MMWTERCQGSLSSRTVNSLRYVSRSTNVKRADTSCLSMRESKDPRQFQDMEHARKYLKSQTSGPSFPGFLQWLSESPGSTAGRFYQFVVSNVGEGQAQRAASSQGSHQAPKFNPAELERLQLLTLLDKTVLARVVATCPRIMELSHGDMAARLILIKGLFKGCDPSILVERLPDCYLLSSEKTLHQMASMMTLLEGQLAGADIVGMVHEDPGLLLLDIEHGIKQFQQLWDVDSTVLEDSDPTELALAVRHLCAAGRD